MNAIKPVPLGSIDDYAAHFVGCRAPGARRPHRIASTASEICISQKWAEYMLPATTQYGMGLCVCVAELCAMEAAFRRHFGKHVLPYPFQIDPRPFYFYARRKHYPTEGPTDGGLLLEHGYDAMFDMGVLPRDVKVRRADNVGAASRQHQDWPVVMGVVVTNGWMPGNVSFDTGQIDEGYKPEFSLAGHALSWVHPLLGSADTYIQFHNSGWYEWGMHKTGYGLMSMDYLARSLLDDFISLEIPEDREDECYEEMLEAVQPYLTQDWGTNDTSLH